MKKFPKLYKQTSTGKVQEWEIWVEGNVIHKLYGLSDGQKQHRTDTIKEGKNIGRANETTSEQQAESEAESMWTKKQEKDYRVDVNDIKKARTTSSFGGFLPMLAHKYTKNKGKVKWPCYVQPKLDGVRCAAKCEHNKVTLWFRSGKPVKTMNHIARALEKVMQNGEVWDGELYIHNIAFNKLGGNIRKDKYTNISEAERIEYHIYDFPHVRGVSGSYKDRKKVFDVIKVEKCIIKVRTDIVADEEAMLKMYAEYMKLGYEGIIIRNMDAPYEQKRSYNLLKYKEFDEAEFKIVGYEEGRGMLQEAVASFVLELPDGNTFKAKMKGIGITDVLKDYFRDPDLFMGKQLTVQYQGLSEDNVPRFPVGKIIRFDK